jgi:hypothetical protein
MEFVGHLSDIIAAARVCLEGGIAASARLLHKQISIKLSVVEGEPCTEMQVSVFIAAWRLILLMFTSIVALSRLDACIFTMLKGCDIGYASFLAMSGMLHSLQV